MSIVIKLVETPIVRDDYCPQDLDKESGSMIEFTGLVRETEDGKTLQGIDYEAFTEMAMHQLQVLAEDIGRLHNISQLTCIHRTGFVKVGEAAVYISIVSSHREEGFAAMTEFITRLKQVVPIWKHIVR